MGRMEGAGWTERLRGRVALPDDRDDWERDCQAGGAMGQRVRVLQWMAAVKSGEIRACKGGGVGVSSPSFWGRRVSGGRLN